MSRSNWLSVWWFVSLLVPIAVSVVLEIFGLPSWPAFFLMVPYFFITGLVCDLVRQGPTEYWDGEAYMRKHYWWRYER